ncbi:DUF2252 family protein [Roseomonas sp. CAU 1739]|uniref:DUF2252 family protein n=1 Tax=Roseomonas sp. CAU 1739 TaxID=3140364 RepID=UPI00325B396F
MTGIVAAADAYDDWLRDQLGGDAIEEDLADRRRKMAKGPFPFFRATYWRWAETVGKDWTPDRPGQAVLAVGDIHLENFGTWRDAEGRLAWGVNDFDEAAVMPWPLDLLRLATSALLARDAGPAVAGQADARAIMAGYHAGLSIPRPIVLDHDFAWLRGQVMAVRDEKAWKKQEEARSEFWTSKMAPPDPMPDRRPPARMIEALLASLPPGASITGVWPRSAGAGSLGRPRWVLRADWQGGPILREAKAMLPSAWLRVVPAAPFLCRAAEVAQGAYRAPDPFLTFHDGVAVRRLSPNNSKLEAKDHAERLLDPEMLDAMGRDLAGIHAATPGAAAHILAEIAQGKPLDLAGQALAAAADRLAARARQEQATLRRAMKD